MTHDSSHPERGHKSESRVVPNKINTNYWYETPDSRQRLNLVVLHHIFSAITETFLHSAHHGLALLQLMWAACASSTSIAWLRLPLLEYQTPLSKQWDSFIPGIHDWKKTELRPWYFKLNLPLIFHLRKNLMDLKLKEMLTFKCKSATRFKWNETEYSEDNGIMCLIFT